MRQQLRQPNFTGETRAAGLMSSRLRVRLLSAAAPRRKTACRCVDIVPVDADLAARAMSSLRRYGKGRHPAGLNFGDCFTYALAELTGIPCCASATTSPRRI